MLMKKSLIFFIMLSSAVTFIACEQNSSISSNTPLEAAKTSAIKKAEPVVFTFKSNVSSDKIEWSVNPSRNVRITSYGNKASILFGEAGRYSVIATDHVSISRTEVTVDTATFSGDTSTVTPIDTSKHVVPGQPEKPVLPVDTSKHVPADTVGTHNVMVSLSGDEFTVTTLSAPDSLSGRGIVLNFISNKSYQCLNSMLSYSYTRFDKPSQTFKIDFYQVIQPGAKYCQQGEKKVSGSSVIYPLSEGSQNLEIKMNNVIYKGTITKAGSTYTISWPYNSGIKFSKLTLTK